MSELDISVQKIPNASGAAVVVVKGSIDAKTVIQFQRKLNSVVEDGIKRIVIDMDQVKYVNSTGLGYLINLADTVGADQGSVVFSNVQPKVKVVFDMLGLNAFFRMFNSLDQAVRAIAEGGAPAAVATPAPSRASVPGDTQSVATSTRPTAPPAPSARPPAAPLAMPAGDRTQLECQLCKASLLVEGTGTYKCPRCFAMFNYSGGDRIVFLPKRPIYPVQLTLNFSTECTEGLINFIRTYLRRSATSLDGLQTEMRNIVDTIRKTSYAGNENNIYHVQVLVKENDLEVRFVDYGKPLNEGLFSGTKRLVDRFELRAHPKGGNIVCLMKRLA